MFLLMGIKSSAFESCGLFKQCAFSKFISSYIQYIRLRLLKKMPPTPPSSEYLKGAQNKMFFLQKKIKKNQFNSVPLYNLFYKHLLCPGNILSPIKSVLFWFRMLWFTQLIKTMSRLPQPHLIYSKHIVWNYLVHPWWLEILPLSLIILTEWTTFFPGTQVKWSSQNSSWLRL